MVDYASAKAVAKPATQMLFAAACLSGWLVVLAAAVGFAVGKPGGSRTMLVSMAVVSAGLPMFIIAIVTWTIGLQRPFAEPVKGEFWSDRRLSRIPPIAAVVALALVPGWWVPGPGLPPGAEAFHDDRAVWNDAADKAAIISVRGRGVRVSEVSTDGLIAGAAIDRVSVDSQGGVWFTTRRREAGGFIWDYWFDGLVRNPGPDPIGNRNEPFLEPLADGWYSFSTHWSD